MWFKRKTPQGPHYIRSYAKAVSSLLTAHNEKEAMSLAIGGSFEQYGILEQCLLVSKGLKPEHTLIDIGCGSGRLAVKLVSYLTGRYIGYDIMPKLVTYAEKICARPDWKFAVAPGLEIPEENDSADMICFFSVFTHLFHDESFIYLRDAARAVKPGGKIVISFLEFRIPSHWDVFEATMKDQNPDRILNQFVSREALETWADKLGLTIEGFDDGDKPTIPIPEKYRNHNEFELGEIAAFGQSVCTMKKGTKKLESI